jgi:hypothetical protein
MRQIIVIALVTMAGLACRAEPAKSPEAGGATAPPAVAASAPAGSSAAVAAGAQPDPGCGRHAGDWCAPPPGDPCGAHKTVASCRADASCTGRKFRGEGPECKFDESGFSTNCPTVGCISR